MSEKTKVAVCVATYKRPEGLKRLTEGLNRLTFNKCDAPAIEIVVVDNDPAGLACQFCEGMRSDLNWLLRCFVEPRRGISYARNKAVARAREEEANFIAFLDDDGVPEASWLDELLHVQRSYEADVVMGPTLAHFPAPVAPWIKKGKFFDSSRNPTGHRMEAGWTGNVLVRSAVFEGMGPKPFDERFALTGGGDRHLFERVRRAGYRIVWADEAVVYEWVPESRANLGWLLRRRYRYGNTYSTLSVEFDPSLAGRVPLVAMACKAITRRLVDLSTRLPRSLSVKPRPVLEIRNGRSPIRVAHPARLVKRLLGISYGAGMLAGVFGKRHEEYGRTHSV